MSAPLAVLTRPAHAWCNASAARFLYIENVPFRCTAQSMQLFHFHGDGAAGFRSPIPATSVVNPEAAPTGAPQRIRPGDRLEVGGDLFEVHVIEGFDSIFPYLRRIAEVAEGVHG